jgi:hypothetical protein
MLGIQYIDSNCNIVTYNISWDWFFVGADKLDLHVQYLSMNERVKHIKF